MEENKRVYKFEGDLTEYFHVWAARTEAALEAKDLMFVVTTDIIRDGEADLQPEVMQISQKLEPSLFKALL